jgi:DNA repair protein RadC
MSASANRKAKTLNPAGVPPAPPEAHQKAGGVQTAWNVQLLADKLRALTVLVGPRLAKQLTSPEPLACGVKDARARYRVQRALQTVEAARALVRAELSEVMRERDAMRSPTAVRDFLRLMLKDQEFESFWVIFLDSQNRVLTAEAMFRGTLSQTSVYPREVVKRALQVNAAGLILAHNHPSGLAEPSEADRILTRALREALALIDVRVLDHFVVGSGMTVSFAERGLL